MAFRKTISQDELRQNLTTDQLQQGKGYSGATGGWTEAPAEQPTAGTGTTDQDSTGARKWWK
ncbi:hypothetical protein OS965_34580 [Streptomyces sp. H27-G5]|uniref:hypothetical protein n=1 Tax=Streptomyces sp. H27-G5 TaxID=2996698 RepID=UPI00227093E7|nr:hypothetical protein [Streptomyces sp. H27-G5]MCY0923206.1 hypothetical protein [Streptomyces sp. H27-G5]